MGRILLFTIIGASLAMVVWMVFRHLRYWFAKEGRRQAVVDLARERERLASLEPGGSPDNPIDIESPISSTRGSRGSSCTKSHAFDFPATFARLWMGR